MPSAKRKPPERWYRYHGDRLTDQALKGETCRAVLRPDGKCICGRSLMLVEFTTGSRAGEEVTVIRQLLRKRKNG